MVSRIYGSSATRRTPLCTVANKFQCGCEQQNLSAVLRAERISVAVFTPINGPLYLWPSERTPLCPVARAQQSPKTFAPTSRVPYGPGTKNFTTCFSRPWALTMQIFRSISRKKIWEKKFPQGGLTPQIFLGVTILAAGQSV